MDPRIDLTSNRDFRSESDIIRTNRLSGTIQINFIDEERELAKRVTFEKYYKRILMHKGELFIGSINLDLDNSNTCWCCGRKCMDGSQLCDRCNDRESYDNIFEKDEIRSLL